MRKPFLLKLFVYLCLFIFLLQACKDDSYLKNAAPVPDQSFGEEFDTTSAVLARGWVFVNTSEPKGGGVWQQGGEVIPWFNAFSNHGNNAGFIGTNYTSTSAGSGIISNWLISPAVILQNGDKIIFYTRALQYYDMAGDSTDYGNRLQVKINSINDGTDAGSGADNGNFKTTLLDINPFYKFSSFITPVPEAYPTRWTRFEATVYGLNNAVKGRFAFRYFVEEAGNMGRGSGVAIDSVTYKSTGH